MIPFHNDHNLLCDTGTFLDAQILLSRKKFLHSHHLYNGILESQLVV